MKAKLVPLLAATLYLLAPAVALADPVTWTLSGVTFDDGGIASGSFIYDADNNTYSAVNITTTGGTTRAGSAYTQPRTAFGSFPDLGFFLTGAGSAVGTPALGLLTSAKTNSGGALMLSGSEADCDDAACTTASGSERSITGGSLVGVAPAPVPVPTLTEWAMILMGLMLAGGAALVIQHRRIAA